MLLKQGRHINLEYNFSTVCITASELSLKQERHTDVEESKGYNALTLLLKVKSAPWIREKNGDKPELQIDPTPTLILLSAGKDYQSKFLTTANYIPTCISEAMSD